jgi:hypothetical protein
MRILLTLLLASAAFSQPLDSDYAQSTTSATTPSMACSGATLIVVGVTDYDTGSPSNVVTSSPSNTWTALSLSHRTSGNTNARLYYVLNPSTSGTMTFSATGSFVSIFVQCWGGGYWAYDAFNKNEACTGLTCQPGSVTPSDDGAIIVTLFASDSTGSVPNGIDLGFTITDERNLAGGTAQGGALAYLEQTTAAATNPTWSPSVPLEMNSTIVAFIPGSAPSTNFPQRRIIQ